MFNMFPAVWTDVPWFFSDVSICELLSFVIPGTTWVSSASFCRVCRVTALQPPWWLGVFCRGCAGHHSGSILYDSTLWWTNIAMERSTILNGKIHYKWPFSIAMLVHQRVMGSTRKNINNHLAIVSSNICGKIWFSSGRPTWWQTCTAKAAHASRLLLACRAMKKSTPCWLRITSQVIY